MNSKETRLPYERLGIEPHSYNQRLKWYTEEIKKIPSHAELWRHHGDLTTDSLKIGYFAYFLGEWPVCHEWSQRAAQHAEEYLMGDWRFKQPWNGDEPDPESFFERQPAYWEYVLLPALGWAAVGRHWEEVGRLLQFPTAKIVADDDGGPAGLAYFLGLAAWWQDTSDITWFEKLKRTRGAGSKGYHLLGSIIQGIAERDTLALEATFPKYVEYFLKRRDHNEQFPLAATFLWNVAVRDSLIVDLSEEIQKFLFELPNTYWETQESA